MTYAADGRSYQWDGKIIGSGQMELLEEDPAHRMDCRLTFLKPWKSVASVSFELVPQAGGTQVHWSMDGSLPFFMFFLKRMMETFVGMGYDRGLKLLKDVVEKGSAPSRLEFLGADNFAGCNYIGVKSRCAIPDIGPEMERALRKLESWFQQSGLEPTGSPFAQYHRWNPMKNFVEYTVGIPVASLPQVTAEFVSGNLPAGPVYTILHVGAYRHLGNAWSAGMSHGRAKLFRSNKSIHPFEIYENSPQSTPEAELRTKVCFPMKG